MAKTIPMPSQTRLKELLSYDPETGIFRWKERPGLTGSRASWNTKHAGTIAGSLLRGYIRIKVGRPLCAHRMAWMYVHGEDPPDQMDHRNGIKHDNRIANLRLADNHINNQNRAKLANNTSGFSGARRHGRMWTAAVSIQNRDVYLGHYATAEEAGRVAHEFRLANHPGYAGRDR